MTRFPSIRQRLAALREDVSGLAMVEFAMALPAFLAFGLTGIEVSNYAISHLKVSQIALSVADNAGRVRTSIDESDIDEVMIGARLAGESIGFGARGRVILSSLEPNGQTGGNAGQMIRWQRCFGLKNVSSSYGAEGAGTSNNSLAAGMGPTGRKITAMPGGAIMFVEVVYDYRPVVANRILGTQVIRYTAAYTVRERTNHVLTNTTNMNTSQRRLCTNYASI